MCGIYKTMEKICLDVWVRGFVKLKKSKNPRKTRKWVGGSSPNSLLFSSFGNVGFLCVFVGFLLLYMFPKKKK